VRSIENIDKLIAKAKLQIKSVDTESNLEQVLYQLYSIGVNDGRKQTSHGKPVCKYKYGVFIEEFENITLAANSIKVDKTTLSKAIRAGRLCRGYMWRLKT
jgi:hypothetical protein